MDVLREAFSTWTACDVLVYVVIPLFVGFLMGRSK